MKCGRARSDDPITYQREDVRYDDEGYVSPLNSTILDDVTPHLCTKRMFPRNVERLSPGSL